MPHPRTLKVAKPELEGVDVREWQHTLHAYGIKTVIDGNYGKNDAKATKALQKRLRLAQTGIVDDKTYRTAHNGTGGKPFPTPIGLRGGQKAVRWGQKHPLWENGNNRSPELDAVWRKYKGDSSFVGEPWCGLYVWWCWLNATGIDLHPIDPVYTPDDTHAARVGLTFKSNDKTYQIKAVSAENTVEGDLVLFDWQQGGTKAPASATDHVGQVLEKWRGGGVSLDGNYQNATKKHYWGDDVVICFARISRVR